MCIRLSVKHDVDLINALDSTAVPADTPVIEYRNVVRAGNSTQFKPEPRVAKGITRTSHPFLYEVIDGLVSNSRDALWIGYIGGHSSNDHKAGNQITLGELRSFLEERVKRCDERVSKYVAGSFSIDDVDFHLWTRYHHKSYKAAHRQIEVAGADLVSPAPDAIVAAKIYLVYHTSCHEVDADNVARYMEVHLLEILHNIGEDDICQRVEHVEVQPCEEPGWWVIVADYTGNN